MHSGSSIPSGRSGYKVVGGDLRDVRRMNLLHKHQTPHFQPQHISQALAVLSHRGRVITHVIAQVKRGVGTRGKPTVAVGKDLPHLRALIVTQSKLLR